MFRVTFGEVAMTLGTKMLFINIQFTPNTDILTTQLHMELTFTTRQQFIRRFSVRLYSSVSSLPLQTQ